MEFCYNVIIETDNSSQGSEAELLHTKQISFFFSIDLYMCKSERGHCPESDQLFCLCLCQVCQKAVGLSVVRVGHLQLTNYMYSDPCVTELNQLTAQPCCPYSTACVVWVVW